MKANKEIHRNNKEASKIYDNRSLEKDFRTLLPSLKKGQLILDIGCGTGSISKDIAMRVGKNGRVIGIDNTKAVIENGKKSYKAIQNLALIHSDLFHFQSTLKFDLIIAARMLQWLTTPRDALQKMKSMLKVDGQISILDYNHEEIEWNPTPPKSMLKFYQAFLNWRSDAGMNNRMSEELEQLMKQVGLSKIEVLHANEYYDRENESFISKVGIWSKVAGLDQIVEEGYISDTDRRKAILEYNHWVANDAISMTMKLNEVKGHRIE